VRVVPRRLSLADPPLREKLGHIKIEADAGADVLLDGRPAGRAPLSLDVAGGDHRIVVGQSGYSVFTKDVTVGRGESQNVEADLGMTTQRIFAWIIIGGTGITITGGVVTAVFAASEQRDARLIDDLTKGPKGRALTIAERNEYNGHITARDNLSRIAGGVLALGALGAGISLLLLTLDEPDLYAAAAGQDEAVEEEDDEGKPAEKKPIDLDAAVIPIVEGAHPGGALVIRGTF
jgi:hypothetical protein